MISEGRKGPQAKPSKKQQEILRMLSEASKGRKMGNEEQTEQLYMTSHEADWGDSIWKDKKSLAQLQGGAAEQRLAL